MEAQTRVEDRGATRSDAQNPAWMTSPRESSPREDESWPTVRLVMRRGGLPGVQAKKARRQKQTQRAQAERGCEGCLGRHRPHSCALRNRCVNGRRGRNLKAWLEGASSTVEADDDGDDVDVSCTMCHLVTWVEGNWMLLCDGPGCNRGYHTLCLDPPLRAVPAGDWLCMHCTSGRPIGHDDESDEVVEVEACCVTAGADCCEAESTCAITVESVAIE